jgi:uncharacterized membrane protein YqjE
MADKSWIGIVLGLFRQLPAGLLDLGRIRLELFQTELELEKRRVFSGLMWGGMAIMVLGLGLVLLCGFVTLLFWDGYRLLAVGVLTGVFLAGGVGLLLLARARLQCDDGMFSASVEELRRDRAQFGD